MPRTLSPERQEELDSLYRILCVFAEVCWGDREDLFQLARTGLDDGYKAKALGGLRDARNDMLAATEALTGVELKQLDAKLRERAGVSLDELQSRRLGQIAKILARGRVTTDEQYYLVRERVEQIWDDPAKAGEFEGLQGLLDEYEGRRARTG